MAELLSGDTFTCPLCGGRYFGRETHKDENGVVNVTSVVACHDEHSVGCSWRGVWQHGRREVAVNARND